MPGKQVKAPRKSMIGGQPHMLAYITPQEANALKAMGGSGEPGPKGIPAFPPESAIAGDYAAMGLSGYDDPSPSYWNAYGLSAQPDYIEPPERGGSKEVAAYKEAIAAGKKDKAIDDKAKTEAIRGSDPAVIGGYSGSVYGGNVGSAIKGSFQNLAQDIKMGLSTFGMSKAKQAEALADAGYTKAQIDSFQSRTAQSMKAAAEAGKDWGGNEAGYLLADVVEETDDETETTESTETTETDVDKAGDKLKDAADAVTSMEPQTTSAGAAEDKAIEFEKKGRRATILTKPSGLLGSGEEEGKTRRRRALIGR